MRVRVESTRIKLHGPCGISMSEAGEARRPDGNDGL